MPPVLRAAALFGVLAWSLAARPLAAQEADDSTRIASVAFDGADAFDEELLRTAILTTPSRCANLVFTPACWFGVGVEEAYVDPRVIGADAVRLRVFYYERGYREAVVALDTTRSDDGLAVRFRVDEGVPVRVDSLAFAGLADMPRELVAQLPLRRGAPLDLIAYEAARDTLIDRLANRGYASADVLASYFIPTATPHSAAVEFELIPGTRARFGGVTVEGTSAVDSAVVRRMLTFRPGAWYSRRALLESQRNLFSLDVFRHAEIATSAASDSVIDVIVRVIEGDLHRVRIGLGLSTADYLNAEARWASVNFLGGARRLEARGRISNLLTSPLDELPAFERIEGLYQQVAGALNVDFRQPRLLGPRNSFGAGLFLERFIVPQVFVRTGGGGYLSVTRLVGRDASLTVGYRPELTSLRSDGEIIFCVNFVACDESGINVLRESHWLSPVSATFVRDRSNSLFAPTRGFRLRAEGEVAGELSGSEFAYARLLGEATAYRQLSRGVVLAARIAAGTAQPFGEPGQGLGLHPQKRFFSGGATSVRGVAQFELGPRLLTVSAAGSNPQGTLVQPIEDVWNGCTAQSVNAGTCDAGQLAENRPDAFDVRPVGGAALIEGNLELRFPIWGENLRGAAFVDAGEIWPDGSDLRAGAWAVTPGLGFRYFSPVGPIRIDVGYNGSGTSRLDVFTNEVCEVDTCDPIEEGRVYAPGELQNSGRLVQLTPIRWNPYDSFFDRLQLHFSIGQAF